MNPPVASEAPREVVVEPNPDSVRPSFLLERALPSILLAVTATTLVLVAAQPLSNTDTFFHLRFGHRFLHGWSLRDPGSVSTFATAHWVPTQWLPEVVMAKAEDWFGLAGVAWLSGVQILTLAATLYLVSRRRGSRAVVATLVPVAMASSYLSLSMRPQLISYIFVVVTLGAWLRTREDAHLRWWLIPMTWVWAMCHGMWPVGIGLGGVAVIGLALDGDLRGHHALRAVLIPLGSAVAAALTPVGLELYVQIVRVQQRSHFFSEWGRPNPLSFSWIVLALLALGAVVLLVRARPLRWFDLALVGVCVVCSMWSWRTVPVAAFLLVPIVAGLSRRRTRPEIGVTRAERGLVFGGVAACLAVLAACVPFTAASPTAQLSAMDATATSLPPGTKVISPWDWGGYLMWRNPGLDLLMHGYGDTYTLAELQRNTDIQALDAGWRRKLRATGCTAAILPPQSRLTRALLGSHWEVVRRSPGVIELKARSAWFKQ